MARDLEEVKRSAAMGLLYSELNTILANIRRRHIEEPTAKERARIAEIRAELQKLKRGELSG